jgi:hypothetical protein
MANPFGKMRGVPDRVLGAALTNHQQTMQWCVKRIQIQAKAQRITSYWLLLLTALVTWLVVQG